jgi:phage baseplate assembly protein W
MHTICLEAATLGRVWREIAAALIRYEKRVLISQVEKSIPIT